MTDGTTSIDIKALMRGGPIRWLILGGMFLIAATTIGTAAVVFDFRERALNSSERELENTVLLLVRHFDEKFEDLTAIQKDVVAEIEKGGPNSPDRFRSEMATLEMHEILRAKVGGRFDAANANVFDSEGALINSSDVWPVPDVKIADRSFFKAFKSGTATTPALIELVHGRLSGVRETIISHKITGPRGEFLGVINRVVTPEKFEKYFASVALGEGAAISMYHRNGTLLARYPHIDAMIGSNISASPIYQEVIAKSDHGTVRLTSPIDGQDRVASARNLSNFPITFVASTTVSAALADWRQQTRFLICVGGFAVLIIAAMLLLLVRSLSQQHRASQRRLRLEKQRLDTAVNNMNQGLVLFDSAQRLVVCNQRYIEMYGLSAEVLKPGCPFREVIEHRKATGSLAGDADQHYARIIRDVGLRKTVVIETPDGRSIQIVNEPLADGGWVATHEDITERRRTEEQIEHLAHFDALTDLPNRALFHEQLKRELAGIGAGKQLAVLYIDIDEFKSVNDSLGHPVGDELLKSVAARLRVCVRDTDFVARLGGDEFAVVQTNIEHSADITDLVARIYQTIREPYKCLGHQVTTDASIGIAVAPDDGTDLDQLLQNADLAMYGAKSDGRRTYRFFEAGMDLRVKARRSLEMDLRKAIVEGDFEVYYQPIVHLQSNEVTGCEALLRWRHPERGMISPAEFIPVAEETGLINQLGEWVLTTACAEAATWPEHIKIAVNVSPIQFKRHTLALKVAGALAATGLAADRLELEITEAVLIRDDESALAMLHQLRALGVRIALDDFGTGYSSLSYLQRFPFDKIKIDRSFVNDLDEPGGSSCIVQAIVNIAAARRMTTTVEGVETKTQRELLRALGCAEMQGYLFSPPKPAAEIKRRFFSHTKRSVAVA
ncbi:MAG TPA: EAL domain-containing protein [Bradyrhizobium sp.]|nr:EAL domain-containing protein [Bradyrhizobium sp.]